MKRKGGMYSSSEFGSWMISGMSKYVSSRRIGSQMIRKICVTEVRRGELSIREKGELSRSMLHINWMSERYRRLM